MTVTTFDIVGTCPLMINSTRGINPLDPLHKEIRPLTSKKTKDRTEEDTMLMYRLKWEQALYYDPDLGPYLLAECVWKATQEAARISKNGKKIERGVVILGDPRLPLKYDGPRDLQGLWNAGIYVDIRNGKPQAGGAIMLSRPIFPEWSVTCSFNLENTVIEEQQFLSFVVFAGRLIGIGAYRRRFGRFSVWQNGVEIGENGRPIAAAKNSRRAAA